MHIYGILKDGNDNPICRTGKETQMYRTDFWFLRIFSSSFLKSVVNGETRAQNARCSQEVGRCWGGAAVWPAEPPARLGRANTAASGAREAGIAGRL